MRLKDFIEANECFFNDDMALIKAFIIENQRELDAIQMIGALAASKAETDTRRLAMTESHVLMLSMNSYRDFYPQQLADLLTKASYLVAIGMDITKYPGVMDELRKQVPMHDRADLLYRNLHEVLKSNGIYFRDEIKD